jgi:archaellum biogenesis protein FlaJ (TadC family)
MVNIYDRSYEIFKPLVSRMNNLFVPLDEKLRIAKIKTSHEKYGAFILLISTIVSVVCFIFMSIFGSLLLSVHLINFIIYLLVSLFIGISVAVFTYFYPNFKISERKSKIENALPFVTIYLSTIVRSGLQPKNMFKMLGRFKQYKTISQEARKINSDIEGLGMDLPTALNHAILRSPSANWTELLAGLRNSLTVGGDTSAYLEEKAHGFIQQYKRRLDEFSKLLALFMNIYITTVIVGLVFFVVISSLMVTIGGVSTDLIKFFQYLLVFVGLPMVTFVFIIIIKSASPWGSES